MFDEDVALQDESGGRHFAIAGAHFKRTAFVPICSQLQDESPRHFAEVASLPPVAGLVTVRLVHKSHGARQLTRLQTVPAPVVRLVHGSHQQRELTLLKAVLAAAPIEVDTATLPRAAEADTLQPEPMPRTTRPIGSRLKMLLALSGFVAISTSLIYTPSSASLAAAAPTTSAGPLLPNESVGTPLVSDMAPVVVPPTTQAPKPPTQPPAAARFEPMQASSHADAAMHWALAQVGAPYRWGGSGNGGFDCSGLVQAAYSAQGVSLPRTAQAQFMATPSVGSLQPGDLVFFGSSTRNVEHVGIYVGNGQMVDAPHAGDRVRVEVMPTRIGAYWGGERYLGATRVG